MRLIDLMPNNVYFELIVQGITDGIGDRLTEAEMQWVIDGLKFARMCGMTEGVDWLNNKEGLE